MNKEGEPIVHIGLRDAITALRVELSDSIRAAAEEQLRFQVGEITLEFQLEVERVAEGSGGIRFWVVEMGAKASKASSLTHTVTVSLNAVTKSGKPVLTGASEQPD